MLENREYDEVVGNPEMPYLNGLIGRGAVATNYYTQAHPSLPNYLALLGGDTFGVSDNYLDFEIAGPNLATQLSRAGVSWRAYMEGMPYPCFTGSSYGRYTKRHNPFAYFSSITAVPERCANVVPATRLNRDLERDPLPEFAWLTPDVCNDGHDCTPGLLDLYLYELMPRIRRALGPHGLLVITWDEGRSKVGCCGLPGGGRIATVLAGPAVQPGRQVEMVADHYSLLAAIEDRFGLPRLRLAAAARPLAPALFRLPGLASR
ncbi:MAG TPA: alkaline phosphatase family protein [Solirubrobacterales bacterium]|nr:alkaline phosphatase family protein [Solirubrobacterales bacterium]